MPLQDNPAGRLGVTTLKDGTIVTVEEDDILGDTKGLGVLGVGEDLRAAFIKVNGARELSVESKDMLTVLEDIKGELKNMNIHLSLITDIELGD